MQCGGARPPTTDAVRRVRSAAMMLNSALHETSVSARTQDQRRRVRRFLMRLVGTEFLQALAVVGRAVSSCKRG